MLFAFVHLFLAFYHVVEHIFTAFQFWASDYSVFCIFYTMHTESFYHKTYAYIYNIFHFFHVFFSQAKNARMFSISICVLISTVKLLHVNLHFNLPRVNITHSHLHPIFFVQFNFPFLYELDCFWNYRKIVFRWNCQLEYTCFQVTNEVRVYIKIMAWTTSKSSISSYLH